MSFEEMVQLLEDSLRRCILEHELELPIISVVVSRNGGTVLVTRHLYGARSEILAEHVDEGEKALKFPLNILFTDAACKAVQLFLERGGTLRERALQ
jgi:hypothetical protein